uniref:Uncharacterized protein n=1 Tax=Siphoviridae sp. ctxc31 TaxID=2826520 RepID=A0A8S5MML5_9CAUD|nr:MAG TPA: hypothetical protein [Siphoviridae sp. ctxc31]
MYSFEIGKVQKINFLDFFFINRCSDEIKV